MSGSLPLLRCFFGAHGLYGAYILLASGPAARLLLRTRHRGHVGPREGGGKARAVKQVTPTFANASREPARRKTTLFLDGEAALLLFKDALNDLRPLVVKDLAQLDVPADLADEHALLRHHVALELILVCGCRVCLAYVTRNCLLSEVPQR